jgi:hypothetical protein
MLQNEFSTPISSPVKVGTQPPTPPSAQIPPVAPLLKFVDLAETQFHPIGGTPICIELINDSFDSSNIAKVNFLFNGTVVSVNSVNASTICSNVSLIEGKNDVYLEALSVKQAPLTFNGTIWAGNNIITVNVLDSSQEVYLGLVNVTATLGDNANVSMISSTTTGFVQFKNLPTRTILFYGRTETDKVGSTAEVAGAASEANLIVYGSGSISSVKNNDFSKGLDGWDIPIVGATIVQHSEIVGPSNPLVPILKGANERKLIFGDLTASVNNDMELCTDGIVDDSRQSFRVFEPANGTTLVLVRYRFVTVEIPKNFFGSIFNDFFRITLRSMSKGSVVTEAATMNGLGEAAFDPDTGSTTWRNTWIPLDPKGDRVSVDITVANVADGIYDSCVYVDFVEEWKCENGEQVEMLFSDSSADTLDAGIRLKHESFWVSSRTGLCGSYQGPQDAFRHCYWSCRMTQSLGQAQAEQVGTYHESCNPEANAADKGMDLKNNEIGRQLGASSNDCETMCLTALEQNKLMILKTCTECAPGECDPYNY